MTDQPTSLPDERLRESKTVFTGRLLRVEVCSVELPDGRRTTREVVRHPGAAAALAELPDGRFVLVEQYRFAVERRLIEVVAGLLEPGEDPADCARREVEEETGYTVRDLVPLGRIWSSAGFAAEALHLFYAKLDGAAGRQALDPDERVRPVILEADRIEAMMAGGDIADGKTLACWLLNKLRRGRGSAAGSGG